MTIVNGITFIFRYHNDKTEKDIEEKKSKKKT